MAKFSATITAYVYANEFCLLSKSNRFNLVALKVWYPPYLGSFRLSDRSNCAGGKNNRKKLNSEENWASGPISRRLKVSNTSDLTANPYLYGQWENLTQNFEATVFVTAVVIAAYQCRSIDLLTAKNRRLTTSRIVDIRYCRGWRGQISLSADENLWQKLLNLCDSCQANSQHRWHKRPFLSL